MQVTKAYEKRFFVLGLEVPHLLWSLIKIAARKSLGTKSLMDKEHTKRKDK
tara:strand:+ start:1006 stop:1158 length:153 start_codon:yes stop_codon:yes gene_type:complete